MPHRPPPRFTSAPLAPSSLTDTLRALAETASRSAETLGPQLTEAAMMMMATLSAGGTLLFCGNGGSAADAQHVATEYVVRFQRNRVPLRALALTTDTSALTACGNDFGFDEIFARQVEALGRPGDLLILHSTSGRSPNLLAAATRARAGGLQSLALLAGDGGPLRAMVDVAIVVPTAHGARAQELHLAIQHLLCDAIETHLVSP